MGRKDRKRTSSMDEDKENDRLYRKIRRLEEKLHRRKDDQRKSSGSRSRSRHRHSSRHSLDREIPRVFGRSRSSSRYTSRQSSVSRSTKSSQSSCICEIPVSRTEKDSEIKESSAVETAEVPEHEVELQEEILNVFGTRLEADKKTAAAVHKDVALRWSEVLKKGLPEEEVKALLVQEGVIKRDHRIVEKQERIAACLAALGKAISISLKLDSSQKLELLEKLSDMGRLLASVHREDSLVRKGLILASLNSSLKNTLSDTSVDEWLFGTDLEEKIKTAKNLERTSKDLRPVRKLPQQSNAQKKTKNWKGPPRQPTFNKYLTTSNGRHHAASNKTETKKSAYRKGSSHQYRGRR
ncbi:uncharacterized protein LOC128884996 [Hylaeus volcanicus]|uniref:uncharacterized protein LOC128884996 n=1 Tax=Hylaeus volcanicus TaxID=313075 RepID=UPI0023B79B66|nr:uncharacterized protein LOC128884996 [Hylaeus volcanicus]